MPDISIAQRYTGEVVMRLAVVLVALFLGAAAPVRAWCEASCLAPLANGTKSHCPTTTPAPAGSAMSASVMDECPVVASARPTAAREDLKALKVTAQLPQIAFSTSISIVASVPHRSISVFQRHTPLRI
jgi:hypothetical protein